MAKDRQEKVLELWGELEKLSNEEFYTYLRECTLRNADPDVSAANMVEVFRRVWVVGV